MHCLWTMSNELPERHNPHRVEDGGAARRQETQETGEIYVRPWQLHILPVVRDIVCIACHRVQQRLRAGSVYTRQAGEAAQLPPREGRACTRSQASYSAHH